MITTANIDSHVRSISLSIGKLGALRGFRNYVEFSWRQWYVASVGRQFTQPTLPHFSLPFFAHRPLSTPRPTTSEPELPLLTSKHADRDMAAGWQSLPSLCWADSDLDLFRGHFVELIQESNLEGSVCTSVNFASVFRPATFVTICRRNIDVTLFDATSRNASAWGSLKPFYGG